MFFSDKLRWRHPVGDKELNAYIDGELAAAARSRVEAHMESCAACRQAVGELRAVSRALQALPGARAPRSFALREADVAPLPGRAQQAGWLAGATPLLGGVATVAVLVFFVLVGVDVSDRSSGGDSSELASLPSEEVQDDGIITSNSSAEPSVQYDGDQRAVEDAPELSENGVAPPIGLPAADDGAEPPEEPLPATGGDIPNDESFSNRAVADEEDGPDESTRELLNREPGGDDSSRLRIAEAATAAVALAAGGSLALVWWRRRV